MSAKIPQLRHFLSTLSSDLHLICTFKITVKTGSDMAIKNENSGAILFDANLWKRDQNKYFYASEISYESVIESVREIDALLHYQQ